MAKEQSSQTISQPWLAHYPSGTPETIDTGAVGTLTDLFDRATHKICRGARHSRVSARR